MNKKELTLEIAKRLEEIRKLYYENYPDGDYLILYFRKNYLSFNNDYWEDGEDENFPIHHWECEETEDDLEEILEGDEQ